MIRIYQQLTIAASTIFGFLALTSHSALAAILTSDFDVNITSGPLEGQTFSGFVSYDDTESRGRGPFFTVTDLDFTFDGNTFTEADGIRSISVITDRQGNVVLLNYGVTSFILNTGFRFSTDPSFNSGELFSYGTPRRIPGGNVLQLDGRGEVVISPLTNPKPIPELTKYAFTIEGFSGGGTLSGTFEAFDFNNNGFIDGDDFFTRTLGVEVFEISNFQAEFTGDSIVRDLTFSQQDILENGVFYQNSWQFLDNGELVFDGFDTESQEGGLFGGRSQLEVVDTNNQARSVAMLTTSVIATPIESKSVPEPTTLFGLSSLGLGLILNKLRNRDFTNS